MKAYRFLQDFKVGIGVPIASGFAGGFIYANYETIFKKGDVAQGEILPPAGDAAPPYWLLNTVHFTKNGVSYNVPQTTVTEYTPVNIIEGFGSMDKNKQWIFIIAALVVAYFLFKK